MQQDTFISHLVELRERLLRMLLAVFIVMAGLLIWPGSGAIYDFLAAPLMQTLAGVAPDAKMIATGVITPFLIPIKVTALAAVMVALPYLLYELWAFIAPGLYEHEKRLALPIVVGSTLLFFLGVAFCYYFVFGRVFSFILDWAPKSISVAPDIENYLNFVITMFIAFGVTFEIPVAVVLLVRSGIVTVEKLAEARSYVILGSAFIAAIITPPDAISMLALFIPMCILFEFGLLVSRLIGVRQKAVESPPSPIDPSGNIP
jgi:sec-independent protein translocase protein TatC